MKKSLVLSLLAVAAISFTSCKKDYTCVCKFSTGTSQDVELKDVSKKDAKAACDTWDKTLGADCSLK